MKEKVAALIDKLQELKKEDAPISELSHYTKLLYAELMCAKSENDKKQSTRKVSVIMPGYGSRQDHPDEQPSAEPVASDKKRYNWQEVERKAQEKEAENKKPLPVENLAYAAEPAKKSQATLWENNNASTETVENTNHQPKELNDLIAEQRPSLNDRLKTEQKELASHLGNTPVKDLHQAIGLNEKFGFINELFRGDQSLYNRSIKTINECKDMEEALYWIDRELKIKLGWQDSNKTVQRFYALIRKRFS